MNETRQTVFRQTPSEYEKLKNDAHAHRMNISEYLRWLIDKQRKEDEGNERKQKNNSRCYMPQM